MIKNDSGSETTRPSKTNGALDDYVSSAVAVNSQPRHPRRQKRAPTKPPSAPPDRGPSGDPPPAIGPTADMPAEPTGSAPDEPSVPQATSESVTSNPRTEHFVITLKFNASGNVASMRVSPYRQSEEAGTALEKPYWDGAELASQIAEWAGIHTPEVQPSSVTASAPAESPPARQLEPAASPATPSVVSTAREQSSGPQTGLSGAPKLRDWHVFLMGSDEPSLSVPQAQPFDVQLTLDLSNVQAIEGVPLICAIAVHAIGLNNGVRQTILDVQETVESPIGVELRRGAQELPEGIYRLTATAVLEASSGQAASGARLGATLDGGLLFVQ